MKKGTSIILLLCCCFFLVGCPATIYDSYTYVGANCIRSTSWHKSTIQLTDKKIIDITCGYYKRYGPSRGHGLYTKLEVPENLFTQKEINGINITSSSLGSLLIAGQPRLYEGNATYYWYQEITDSLYTLKSTRKKLRSDTMTITIANTTLLFTKKSIK